MSSKAPTIKFSPWPKTNWPWLQILIDFAGLLDGYYYFIVVDSFSKWPEILKCKTPTMGIVINFLHELFSRFGVAYCIVFNNGTQFTSIEWKDFCQTFLVELVMIAPYQPRSNSLVERFVDMFKRLLKKAKGTPTDTAIQKSLKVYWITPNKNAPSDMTPAEVMVARKIRSVFNKLIPQKQISRYSNKVTNKHYEIGENHISHVPEQQNILGNGNYWKKGSGIRFTWSKDQYLCIKGT